MKSSSDGDGDGEIGALRRIEIVKEIIGVIEIGVTAGPRIVVDAAEAGQEEKGSAIVRSGIVNFLASSLRIDGHGFEPIRNTFAHIFLKKGLALDSVGVAAQNQRPFA